MNQSAHATLLIAALGLAAIGACSSGPEERPISTGLSALDDPARTRAAPVDASSDPGGTESKLKLMEEALLHSDVSVDAGTKLPPRKSISRPAPARPAPESHEPPPLLAIDEPPEAAPAKFSGALPASADALAAMLAEQLRESARASAAPAASLLRLAALKLVSPGSGGVGGAAAEALDESALAPHEREFLAAWRELFAAARANLSSGADLAPLIAQVGALAERMQAGQPLSILTTRLCTRVDGFGSYAELPRAGGGAYGFIAGRRARAIVYLELANFTSTPKSEIGAQGFGVNLTQSIDLFDLTKDGQSRVWGRSAQPVTDFSRSRRRDFYVTQVIDLPPTLAAGEYRLKVTMIDSVGGAVAETIVPIELAAEALTPPR